MRRTLTKHSLFTRALLVGWLLAAQCVALAHEVTHPVFEDSEICMICSVGGHADAAVHNACATEIPQPWTPAPYLAAESTLLTAPLSNHRARAPPASL